MASHEHSGNQGSNVHDVYFAGTSLQSSDCSGMGPSLEEYRKFAEECRRLAQLAKAAEEKKILKQMEAAWVEVIERADGKGS